MSKTLKEWQKDPGFLKAGEELGKDMAYRARMKLCRAAVEACVRHRERLEPAFATGNGIWVEEMAPLAPAERTIVLEQIVKLWNLQRFQ